MYIIYIYVHQYAAARACSARNFPTFLGRLWLKHKDIIRNNKYLRREPLSKLKPVHHRASLIQSILFIYTLP